MAARWIALALAGIAAAVFLAPAQAADPTPSAGHPDGYVGAETCAACHDPVAKQLAATAHGKTHVTDRDGGAACESCHGPGAAHAESGDATKIRSLKKLTSTEQSAACLTCH